ncbi:MAG: PhoH family protein [Alphaproteobacteria bacterium]
MSNNTVSEESQTVLQDDESVTVERTLSLPSNHLAAAIFGEHDQNLARLQQKLGIVCQSKGNLLNVSGTKTQIETIERAMRFLVEQAGRGENVNFALVDAAARLAEVDEAQGSNATTSALEIKTSRKIITPRSPGQKRYVAELQKHEMVFGLGPAGTGKTYLAVAKAISLLIKGDVDKLILTRPAVEAGEKLGFLPGDMKDKVDPYLRPLYDALNDMMAPEQVLKRLEQGQIEVAPIAFMRGRTLSNAFVIMDEAQNTTPVQMKMVLTRLGEGSRMAINGDLSQIDLPRGQKSGLLDAVQKLDNVKGIGIVTLTQEDVVRHDLVARIVAAYDKA